VIIVASGWIGAGCGPGLFGPASPQEIHQALQESLVATGTATPDSRTQYLGMSYRTYLAWEVELTLENQSKYSITFGDDLILVEADASGGTYDGVVVTFDAEGTMPRLEDTDADDLVAAQNASCYSLSNAEVRYASGGTSYQRGNTVGITFSESSQDEKVPGFGALDSGESRTLKEDLELGAWVSGEHRASLRIVLPELIVERGGEAPARLRWVLYFKQPGTGEQEWVVDRQEVVLLEPEGLEQQLIVPETNQVTRVLAANWLADLDPDRARAAMVQVAQGLPQGDLLAVCLSHLIQLRGEGLGEHAQSLLSDTDAPNGIRRLAAEYLGTTRYQPALAALTESSGDEDGVVATGAIEALGTFAGPEASAALLELATGKVARDHRVAILHSLACTRESDALGYLEERARNKDGEALTALVGESAPESFEFFVELAGSPAHRGDRDQLARGLTRSGGERASDQLLAWLAEEELPNEDAPLVTSTVVDELSGLDQPALVPRLRELAGDGHLPALQVLAHYQDPSARESLEQLARELEGAARLIALDGLSRRWPEGNEELFEQALRKPADDLVPVAVRGLRSTRPDALPSLLLPLVQSDDEAIRSEAATALSDFDPGSHGDGYLEAILSTSDGQIAANLVSALVDHQWEKAGAVGELAAKLEQSQENDMRFQLIRLMRHLSGDAQGPENYSEFWDKPDEWTKRWVEWAKLNAASS